MIIEKFDYSDIGKKNLETKVKGKNWPVIYMISNDKSLYVGETTSASTRMQQHLQNKEKQAYNFKEIRVVFDDEYNKSVILDYEQRLIKCFETDKQFNVINKNEGQSSSHNYSQRDIFSNKFNSLWQEIINNGLAKNSLSYLENQNIFKYSPYNSLTEEQNDISVSIINDICDKLESGDLNGISLIDGCAGTGKTVLAISIINSLINAVNLDIIDMTTEEANSDKVLALLRLKKYLDSSSGHALKIGFVFPMSGIRKTISKVFKNSGNGLNPNMVLSPYELKNQDYDILLVDESHRLHRRKNLGTLFGKFDEVCQKLGLNKDTSSQLDWVLKQGKYNILFYDKDQSIKSSDITFNQYNDSIKNSLKHCNYYELTTQMRCKGGDTFISYLKDLINCDPKLKFKDIENYEFKIFDDVDVMINQIKSKDANPSIGLSKTVAGFSWPWKTKGLGTYKDIVSKGEYDIDIDGNHYIWNIKTEDWISRDDSHETIGCIHTTQGFDLNYVGVIFGKEIDYDPLKNSITIDLNKFYDGNVKAGCNENEVKQYIINTYTTIMARGIKGCYVYACNKGLSDYLHKFIRKY